MSSNFQPEGRALQELEAVPKLYFGREAETLVAVDTLTSSTAGRVAVLGGPGMGKTTLALAVLHHPVIATRFAYRRYFVACDAAEGQSSCLAIIAGAFGIVGSDVQTVQQNLLQELSQGPTLLVLDNFESTWESPETRAEAETVLQLLAGVDALSIIITLRGSERPQGVSWTRPFLPPLSPLEREASRQVFLAISDRPDADPVMDTLLDYVENVPLAVVLIANLAQYESPTTLLARWEEQKTAMVQRGDGQQRLNSLDVSISLSIGSPRVREVPEALRLLSVLSLLPQGVVDTDLALWAQLFPARALSVLLRTALAYRGADQRIHVLAPIRTFVLEYYPPSREDAGLVYGHYFSLTQLLLQRPATSCPPEAIAAIAPEVENVDFIIRYALGHNEDLSAGIAATESMCTLYANTGMGSGPDLLPLALSSARKANLQGLVARLLRQWGSISYNMAVPGDPFALFTESRQIYESIGDTNGVLDASINLIAFLPPVERVNEARRLLQLAKDSGSAVRVAKAGQQLALGYVMTGQPGKAVEELERAVNTLRSAQGSADSALGYMVFQMAEIYANIGNLGGALAKLDEALPIFRATGFNDGISGVYMLKGLTHLQQGETAKGVESLQHAFTSIRASGSKDDTHCLLHLVRGHLTRGDEPQALAAVETAQALIEGSTAPSLYRRTWLLCSRAEIELYHGHGSEGGALLSAVRQAWNDPKCSEVHEVVQQIDAFVLQMQGRAQQAAGDATDALSSFVVSALLWRKFESCTDVVRALSQLMEVVEDDTADVLGEALLLPLHRFGYRPVLGNVLLRLAEVASRRNDLASARLRGRRALTYLDRISDAPRHTRAQALLRWLRFQ
ncbi:hypothetical protein AURDEDRAFT_136851 [Auricularia subglabra TFB-10046 SS5]|nr:hypothetical protein AURDEDRAFT_136851 [Auricularia subglabra TFB-10046 SS5]